MIVEMCKLRLLGLNSQKDDILNLLFETGKLQLNTIEQIDNTTNNFCQSSFDEISNQKDRLKRNIDFVEQFADLYNLHSEKLDEVDLNTFKSANSKEIEKIQLKIEDLRVKLDNSNKILADCYTKINLFSPYLPLKERFSSFKGTKSVDVFLGLIPSAKIVDFDEFVSNCHLTIYQIDGENIIKVYSHKSESQEVLKKLGELGAIKCEFLVKDTAENIITNTKKQIQKCQSDIEKYKKEVAEVVLQVNKLKLCYDYLGFCQQKLQADNMFASTEKTFFLEAFLTKESQNKVEKVLEQSGFSIEFEFLKIAKKDNPPVVIQNNKIIAPFEFVTNMYSPPNYRELDPNGFIAFFFSIFFGFIMADIGYGLVLFFGGLIISKCSKKRTSFSTLMQMLSICGVTTIIFGVLFGSFFGLDNAKFGWVPVATFPNPVKDVMSLLIACLGAGIFQIMVSYFLKGVLALKRKQPLVAFFSGFVWEVFFVGLILICLQVLNLTTNTLMIGLVVAGVSLLICVIGQIFINKGFDRVAKSFGAVYGIINIMSDTLSYARLFGLMLSGAIISTIVNDLASSFFNNIFMSIIGVVILLIGHTFNLFMGALSAYIHVARLQYVEFFSRFYEGEGELFKPFGTEFSYISNIKNI